MISPEELEKAAYVARKIRGLLADEDVKAIFERLDRDAYERFRTAETEPQRLEAWAFSRALAELKASLEGAMEAGDLAMSENPDLQ